MPTTSRVKLSARRVAVPFVSVVIPHRGNDGDLEECLSALGRQTYSRKDFEVIVIVSGPPSQAIKALAVGNVQIIPRQKPAVYAARNEAIRRARGTVIALTDSDAVPDRHWIERAVELVDGKKIIIAGSITLTFSSFPLSPAACYEKLFSFDQKKNVRAGRGVTANMITAKSVFADYGYFRESAITGEDFLWSQRVVSSGVPIVFSELAQVSHPARESAIALLKKSWRDSYFWEPQLRPKYRIVDGYLFWHKRYFSLPSSSRLKSCSKRELFLALMMFQVVQSVKLVGFLSQRFKHLLRE